MTIRFQHDPVLLEETASRLELQPVLPLGQRYPSFIVGYRMGLRNRTDLYDGLDCGFIIGGFDGIAMAFAGARLAC